MKNCDFSLENLHRNEDFVFVCENVYIFSPFESHSGYLAHFNNVFILEHSWLSQCKTFRWLSIFVRVLNHEAVKGGVEKQLLRNFFAF